VRGEQGTKEVESIGGTTCISFDKGLFVVFQIAMTPGTASSLFPSFYLLLLLLLLLSTSFRIVPFLKEGAGVVTSRAQVHYVVTEYGIAFLFGKTLPERAKALIAIAHPDDR